MFKHKSAAAADLVTWTRGGHPPPQRRGTLPPQCTDAITLHRPGDPAARAGLTSASSAVADSSAMHAGAVAVHAVTSEDGQPGAEVAGVLHCNASNGAPNGVVRISQDSSCLGEDTCMHGAELPDALTPVPPKPAAQLRVVCSQGSDHSTQPPKVSNTLDGIRHLPPSCDRSTLERSAHSTHSMHACGGVSQTSQQLATGGGVSDPTGSKSGSNANTSDTSTHACVPEAQPSSASDLNRRPRADEAAAAPDRWPLRVPRIYRVHRNGGAMVSPLLAHLIAKPLQPSAAAALPDAAHVTDAACATKVHAHCHQGEGPTPATAADAALPDRSNAASDAEPDGRPHPHACAPAAAAHAALRTTASTAQQVQPLVRCGADDTMPPELQGRTQLAVRGVKCMEHMHSHASSRPHLGLTGAAPALDGEERPAAVPPLPAPGAPAPCAALVREPLCLSSTAEGKNKKRKVTFEELQAAAAAPPDAGACCQAAGGARNEGAMHAGAEKPKHKRMCARELQALAANPPPVPHTAGSCHGGRVPPAPVPTAKCRWTPYRCACTT